MITLLDLLNLVDPIERMYMNTTSQVIINLCRHLGTGKRLPTDEWRIKKLSELNSITNETIEIIAANTGRLPYELREAFQNAMLIGTAETNSILQRARQAGLLRSAPSMEDSQAMADLLQAYVAQAQQTFNLVNTNMLNSTIMRYTSVINDVSRIEALQKVSGEQELREKLLYTQGTLNMASSSVVTGIESRTQAVRDAIKDLTSKGITGWIDAGGHHWTAEAYVNMDIRTTCHNVAIEAQKERSAEYGVSTFQISTHSGARPLCAPYQGWICSWEGGGYTVHDLYGKEYLVHDINTETTYGEAAGIFGINCGHFPETFVDGFSVPRYNELTPEQEKQNTIEYAQSQQQRQIEREIRQAKTDALGMKAANDPAGFAEASKKVKEKNAEYRSFCDQTGRTPRPDRTQVVGYNRKAAAQANAWAKKPANTQGDLQAATKKREKSQFLKNLEAQGVGSKKVSKLAKKLTDDEIIKRLGGADQTSGSCASLTLAYAGNKAGYDVLDFRGGKSQSAFSRGGWKSSAFYDEKLHGSFTVSKNDIKACNDLMAQMQAGKQYSLVTGSHAAIVRIDPDTGAWQWLELQSANNNGWHDMNDDVLKWRFGCRQKGKYEFTSALIDIDEYANNPEFRSILSYINTAEGDQHKGKGGGIK